MNTFIYANLSGSNIPKTTGIKMGDKSWEKITSPTQPKPSALVWSHDGRTIAYNRNIPDEKSGKSFTQIFVIFINDNYLP